MQGDEYLHRTDWALIGAMRHLRHLRHSDAVCAVLSVQSLAAVDMPACLGFPQRIAPYAESKYPRGLMHMDYFDAPKVGVLVEATRGVFNNPASLAAAFEWTRNRITEMQSDEYMHRMHRP